jgi:hypothetical protein
MYRRLFWSLLLAFILPLAQVAAATHELSHLKSAPTSIQCDHCALAAAVSGGAAPSAPPAVPAVELHDSAPTLPAASIRAAEPFTAFSSRAPPSSQ